MAASSRKTAHLTKIKTSQTIACLFDFLEHYSNGVHSHRTSIQKSSSLWWNRRFPSHKGRDASPTPFKSFYRNWCGKDNRKLYGVIYHPRNICMVLNLIDFNLLQFYTFQNYTNVLQWTLTNRPERNDCCRSLRQTYLKPKVMMKMAQTADMSWYVYFCIKLLKTRSDKFKH